MEIEYRARVLNWGNSAPARGHWAMSGMPVVIRTRGLLESSGWDQRCCSTPYSAQDSPLQRTMRP